MKQVSLKGKRIGLVLSGGGAKGAYQTGMLRALEEAGMEKRLLTIAGTSIGALNGLLYATADTDALREMIGSLPDMKDRPEEYAEKVFPDDRLLANRIPVTVCAYCLETERPEYFLLNDLTPRGQRTAVVASARLPDLFEPAVLFGRSYLDGGKIPPQCSADAQPADKIPLGALAGGTYDLVIVSYLKPEDTVDRTLVRAPYLEIWPSEPLEDEPGTGTRDYSPDRLARNERMGYEETKLLLGV